jgi:hypothetical protein
MEKTLVVINVSSVAAFQQATFGYRGRAPEPQHALRPERGRDGHADHDAHLLRRGRARRRRRVERLPGGGGNPAARFFYAELTERF